MMKLGELPVGWAAVTLEAVADIHDNLREPVNSTERKSRVGPFPYYGATGQVGWIDDFRQDGEYVLLGEDGAPFFDPTKDKAYLVSGKCWVNNHAHVLRGREGVCLNRYLLYALNQVNYRGFANGTTRLKLTQAAMRQLPINLAPLAEQHRIIAKIEELFSELDQGVASLKNAREQLKVYRQSLLKNAFEGKLTAAWRAAHADQLETATALQQRIARERQARYQQQLADWQTAGQAGPKPKPPKPLPPLTAEELAELPVLPEGWVWLRLGCALDAVSGNTPKGIEQTSGKEVPFYRVSDMNREGNERYMNSSATYLSKAEAKGLGLAIYPAGTILFPKRGGAIATNKKRRLLVPACFDLNLMGLTNLPNGIGLDYLWNWVLSVDLASISDGSNVPQINNRNVEPLAFPVCSLAEQLEIVQELESKLSEADQLDQTLATALQQADALRQSILKKAFCGQLVKQDKNDEPATALLERIRAARATSPAKGRQAKLVSKSLTNC